MNLPKTLISFLKLSKQIKYPLKSSFKCLSQNNINDMVSDTLQLTCSESCALSTFIYEKTKGNAFFVTQLFRELVNDRFLYFNDDKGH